jgi:hypothetical protein
VHRELVCLGAVLELFEDLVADLQALLGSGGLEVEIGEVLGRREVVVSVLDGGL